MKIQIVESSDSRIIYFKYAEANAGINSYTVVTNMPRPYVENGFVTYDYRFKNSSYMAETTEIFVRSKKYR